MTIVQRYGLGLLLTTAAACGTGERRDVRQPDSAGPPTMGAMPGMGSMGGMASEQMIREMRAHMQGMTGTGADSLRRLMPMQRQIAANMLQQMEREMSGMRVAADSSWKALADSVRQDLTRLPDVSTAELPEFIERHRARVERLMARHTQMMGGR